MVRAVPARHGHGPTFSSTSGATPLPGTGRRKKPVVAMDPPSAQVMSATDDLEDKTVDEW